MDFMLNGPRLQASLFDGFDNMGCTSNPGFNANGFPNACVYDGTSAASSVNYPSWNNFQIVDRAEGRQTLGKLQSGSWGRYTYFALFKYALRTTSSQNIYLVCTVYRLDSGISWIAFERCEIGKGPWSGTGALTDYSAKLDINKWRLVSGAVPTAYTFSSNNCFCRTSSAQYYLYQSPTEDGNWTTNANAAVGLSISGDNVYITVRFPATYRTILHRGNSNAVNLFPIDMRNRKFATYNESISVRSSTSTEDQIIQKVYSPYKNCMCLKSYLHGEIPILNE